MLLIDEWFNVRNSSIVFLIILFVFSICQSNKFLLKYFIQLYNFEKTINYEIIIKMINKTWIYMLS